MPEVLTPSPGAAAPMGFNAAAFDRAYARAGRPAIALLWNREFSDMLEQNTVTMARKDAQGAMIAGGQATRTGTTGTRLEAAEVRSTVVVQVGEVKTQQQRRLGPAENVDLQMRNGPRSHAMTSGGVALIDRNTVMRTTGRGKAGADAQQVETDALDKHAALLMEVLNTPDPASPTGWATQVSIKRVKDGRILATGYVDGRLVDSGPQRFEANQPAGGGFREVAAPTAQPSDLGRMAAEHALARLGQALAP